MFKPTYPLYTASFYRYWMVQDKPVSQFYLPAKKEERQDHKSMLFHVSAGDYITTLASIMRFFEESIKYNEQLTPEMRSLQLKIIKNVIDDLLYLNSNYTIIPKKSPKNKKNNE